MARVIVILTLLFLITAGIFYLTRPADGPRAGNGKTTVALPASGVAQEGAAGTTVATAQDVVGGPVAGAAPAFATVGVDHRGRASFTGTAGPGDKLSILSGDKVLGRGRADEAGSWSIAFKMPRVTVREELRIRSLRAGGDSVDGPQRVQVVPPERPGGLPVLRIVSAAPVPEEPFSAPGPDADGEPNVGIIIETVDTDDTGKVSLAGRADAGATMRLEMGGKAVGTAKVGRDGRWALEARNTTGREVKMVRVVLVGAKGKQIDASTLPLRLPGPSVITSAAGSQVDRVHAVASGGGRWVKVRRGDSLWKLARRHYGNGAKWTRILKANRRRISDPDLILPGWRLRLP